MRNFWIRQRWTLTFKKMDGEWYDFVEIRKGPYKADLNVLSIRDIRDANGLSAVQELTLIVCRELCYHEYFSEKKRMSLTLDEIAKVQKLIRLLREGTKINDAIPIAINAKYSIS